MAIKAKGYEGGFEYISGGRAGEICQFINMEGERTNGVIVPSRDSMMDNYMQTVFNFYTQVLVGLSRIPP